MVASYRSLQVSGNRKGRVRRQGKWDSLTYDAQRGLAAVTEALEHRVAHETDQHVAFVPFRSKGVGFASGSRGNDANDRSRTPEPRHWEGLEGRRRRRRDQDRKEWVRHTGSVAQVVTGAVAGGRLARTLRRDARRRSISPDHPSLPPLHHPILPFLARVMQPTAYPTTSYPSNWQLEPAIVTIARTALRGML